MTVLRNLPILLGVALMMACARPRIAVNDSDNQDGSARQDASTHVADLSTHVADLSTHVADLSTHVADLSTHVADLSTHIADAADGGSDLAGHLAKSHIGVFHDGHWIIDSNDNGIQEPGVDLTFSFGQAGDIPVTGDWTGDGRTKIGVFHGKNGLGQWSLDWDGDGVWNPAVDKVFSFGLATDTPVIGDWSGSGTSKIGVFYGAHNAGVWNLDLDGDGIWNPLVDGRVEFGLATDTPVTGDWSRSGTGKIGIFRSGIWNLDSDGDGTWNPSVDKTFTFGLPTDVPIAGDWNGDGRAKLGVFRSGQWSLDSDGDGVSDRVVNYGASTDQPVAFWY